MKYLRSGLGAVLLFAIVIRLSAEIIAPVMPVLIVLFVLVSVMTILIRRTLRL